MNNKLNIPWIEKYRPKYIDDLILDDDVKTKIKEMIKTKEIPNIIMSGLPSMGKTSTVLCIVREILGNINHNENVIELNASDNRGLEIINNSIIHFCKKTSKNNNLKFVILDEADSITTKAQHIFNILMDKYISTTRFIFTCNDSSKIIESIQSKCVIFRFRKIPHDKLYNRLKFICKKEKIPHKKSGLNRIINVAFDDIRQAINILEATYYGYGEITKNNVEIAYDQPKMSSIKRIIDHCIKHNLKDAINELNNVLYGENSENMTRNHYHNNILLLMVKILKDINISEEIRINMISIINDYYIVITSGINSKLQLYACLAKMCN
jgi:replication factor C subunit 2/4